MILVAPESAHAQWYSAHLLSFRLGGSDHFLVKKHLVEVCSLSRGMMLQPLSGPLQAGVRFLRVPLPTLPSAFLAVGLPSSGENILYYRIFPAQQNRDEFERRRVLHWEVRYGSR